MSQKVKLIKVDVSSGIPIYLQIKEEIKRAFAQGFFSPGEKLPPVREMALYLKINPNTVARAYQELEKENYVVSRVGKGTFFKEREVKKEEKIKVLEPAIRHLVTEAKKLNFSQSELLELIKTYLEGSEER